MVGLASLWLPIVLSAMAVFIGSSVLHMVLSYHKSDYAQLPDEGGVQLAMRKASVQPGFYHLPYCVDPKELADPEVAKRYEEGPVAFVTVVPSGVPSMARPLISWFVLCLVIATIVAYLASRTVPAGAEYLMVFRVTGTAALLGFAGATPIETIWKGQPWGMTAKHLFDGLIYSLLTAGVFGWLWPS